MRAKWNYLDRKPRFIIEKIKMNNPAWSNAFDANLTRRRIARTGPLSILQYKRIWNQEAPVFGRWMGVYEVQGVRKKLSSEIDRKWLGYIQDLPNFRETCSATILHGKNIDENRIFHNLSNINGLLYFMKLMNAKPSDVLFDGELNAKADEWYWGDILLRPDGVIMSGNKIVFLETDNGTHDFKTLLTKSELYKKLIDSWVFQKMGYTNITIVIQSYSKRIYGIQKNGCMKPIEKHVEYLDYLDNEFQYMNQWLGGTDSAPEHYKGLDEAVKKAKIQWEQDIDSLLWEGKHNEMFRDPRKFLGMVATLFLATWRNKNIV